MHPWTWIRNRTRTLGFKPVSTCLRTDWPASSSSLAPKRSSLSPHTRYSYMAANARRFGTTPTTSCTHDSSMEDELFADMVCNACGHDISSSKYLRLMEWNGFMNVTLTTAAALENVHCVKRLTDASKNIASLFCGHCHAQVGNIRKARGDYKALFYAKKCHFRFALTSAPLLSISGMPTREMKFDTWLELEAFVRRHPRVTGLPVPGPFSHTKVGIVQVNQQMLLAPTISAILDIVDTTPHDCLNQENTIMALKVMAERFHHDTQKSKQTYPGPVPRRGGRSNVSEAPEDHLTSALADKMASSAQMARNIEHLQSQRQEQLSLLFQFYVVRQLISSRRCRAFIQDLENRMENGIHLFQHGDIIRTIKSLVKLRMPNDKIFKYVFSG